MYAQIVGSNLKYCNFFVIFGVMLKYVIAVLLTVVFSVPLTAQETAGTTDTTKHNKSHLRISLLTCGPGLEIYETFGHSCIRIIDSTKTGRGRDLVYNYGFVESSADNTVLHQFLTGRVQTYLATNTIAEFNYQYSDEKRSVTEQVFLLGDKEKEQVQDFLKNNALYVNRYYEYSSAYDNCSTRILGMFVTLFGNRFVPGQVLPKGYKLRMRELTASYRPLDKQHKYWFALAMEIFYGCRANSVASNMDAMYLADYLSDGMAGATLDGKKLCTDKSTIFEEKISWPSGPDWPFIVFLIVLVLTVSGFLVKRLRVLGALMMTLLLLVTGGLGCYLLYFMVANVEPGWKDNFNLLWALPTNLIIPFCSPRIKARYSVAAMFLIILAVLVSILRVQELPLFEIGSILLALIFVYGILYRKSIDKIKSK